MDFKSVSLALENIKKIYRGHLLTTNFCSDDKLVSWNNYVPLVNKRYSYLWEYQYLLNCRQYSFLFSDNSFFQFFFKFDSEGVLKKAKLAYYPYPITASSVEKIEELFEAYEQLGLDISDESWIELLRETDSDVRIGKTSHFRLDYDDSVGSHDKAHFQYSALNEMRISSSVLLNPFLFMHFVFTSIDYGRQDMDWFRKIILTNNYSTILNILKSTNHNHQVETASLLFVNLGS